MSLLDRAARGAATLGLVPKSAAALGATLTLAAALVLSSSCRCQPESPPQLSPDGATAGQVSEPAASKSVRPEAVAPESTPVQAPERIWRLITQLPRKGRCSRLMGCDVAETIVREGVVAVAPLIALYEKTDGDYYWRARVLDTLGRIGGDRAVSFLIGRLGERGERLRTEVALALGHLKASEAREPLLRERARVKDSADIGYRLALAYALARLGEPAAGEESLSKLIAEAADSPNPGHFMTALTVLRWLNVREQTAPLKRAIASDNLFVRRMAIRLVRDWRLRELIPEIIDRLDVLSKGGRREAVETLKLLTGMRYKETRAQWERWCRQSPRCELVAKPEPEPDRDVRSPR